MTPDTDIGSGSGTGTSATYVEPESEGDEDEEMAIAPAEDEDKRTGLTSSEVAEASAYREKMLKDRAMEQHRSRVVRQPRARDIAAVQEGDADDEDEDADERTPMLRPARAARSPPPGSGRTKPRTLSIDPLAPSSAFDQSFKDKLKEAARERRERAQETAVAEENDDTLAEDVDPDDDPLSSRGRRNSDRELVRHFIAPPGKRIAVPVRVEPKVYFAAERTFLVSPSFNRDVGKRDDFPCFQSWLQFGVLIGSIATALLNFLPPDDDRGLIAAGLFTFSALAAIAYSGVIFVHRALRLRARDADGLYYDKYGPSVLCITLFAALAVNLGLRWENV